MKLFKTDYFKNLLLISLLSCSFSQAAIVIHTNDVLGDIEPCGCRHNPQGGMARKYNLIQRTLAEDPFVIQVDAGDLLFPTDDIPELLKDQAELQAQYLLESMELIHHDIVVPGEKDFALGLKTFEKLIGKSPKSPQKPFQKTFQKTLKIQFLAANLKRKNGKSFLSSHAILTGKDAQGKTTRVGIFGLVGENLKWPQELKATAMIQAAQNEVAFLKGKADFIIAVTHQGLEADQKLARTVQGIDMIVGGHSQSFLQTPAKTKSTYLLQSSFRNQYIGKISLSRPWDPQHYQLLGLDIGYESPEETPSPMDQLVVRFKKAVADLNTRQDALLAKNSEKSLGRASIEATEKKYQTFPQCAGCHLKQFDFWRKTPHARALNTLVEKQQEKNKECLGCHTVGLGDPKGFQNVNILAEVSAAPLANSQVTDSQDSPQPVASPRFLSPLELNSFLNAMTDAKSIHSEVKLKKTDSNSLPMVMQLRSVERSWAPVQCENCHTPGGNHPFTGLFSKNVEKTTCLSCHTAERAPEWYTSSDKSDQKVPNWKLIEAKRAMITCPAGDLSVVDE